MEDSSHILINQCADKVENIILNDGFSIEKFFHQNDVYKIINEKKEETNWVLKTYKNEELARTELDCLLKAKNII